MFTKFSIALLVAAISVRGTLAAAVSPGPGPALVPPPVNGTTPLNGTLPVPVNGTQPGLNTTLPNPITPPDNSTTPVNVTIPDIPDVPVPTTPLPPSNGTDSSCTKIYTVVEGDTCWGIAAANKVPSSQLLKANDGAISADCINLQIGQQICLAKSDSCAQTHTVQAGDVCESVASTYSIKVDEIYSLNSDVSSDCLNLDIGMTICVSGSSSVAPPLNTTSPLDPASPGNSTTPIDTPTDPDVPNTDVPDTNDPDTTITPPSNTTAPPTVPTTTASSTGKTSTTSKPV